jgi:hypothetical protein
MQLRTLRWRGNCLACAMPTAVLQVLATQLGLLPISPPIPQDAETRRAHLARMRQQWVVRWRVEQRLSGVGPGPRALLAPVVVRGSDGLKLEGHNLGCGDEAFWSSGVVGSSAL